MVDFEFVQPDPRSRLLRLSELRRIANVLRAGGLAILPTETGYMIGARASSPDAVGTVFRIKGRSRANVMHVACSSLAMVDEVAVLSRQAEFLIGELTPGPLSVVVPQTDALPDGLVTVNGTVGIRVPNHPATLQVIAAVGEPLTATSLNTAGQAPISVRGDAFLHLAWPATGVVVVVEDEAAVVHNQPSTLVRMVGDGLELLREGPVALDQIATVLDRMKESDGA